MIAAMVLTNLLYVLGAVVAATLVSALVLFRHRRPKSLEAGIELFSRELKALQPESDDRFAVKANRVVPRGPSGRGEFRPVASRAPTSQARRRGAARAVGSPAEEAGESASGEAVTRSPDQEGRSG